MRSYPRNSPEAAARLVALVLISDGHVCRSEIEALNHLQLEAELGLAAGGFARVIHTLCEDLLLATDAGPSSIGRIDESTLSALLAEVDQAALQGKVLRLAGAAAAADRHLAEAEAMILALARRQWTRVDDAAAPATPTTPQATGAAPAAEARIC